MIFETLFNNILSILMEESRTTPGVTTEVVLKKLQRIYNTPYEEKAIEDALHLLRQRHLVRRDSALWKCTEKGVDALKNKV